MSEGEIIRVTYRKKDYQWVIRFFDEATKKWYTRFEVEDCEWIHTRLEKLSTTRINEYFLHVGKKKR